MRFLLSLLAGLLLVGAAPLVAADAASTTPSVASATAAGQPAKATFGAGPASTTKLDGRPYFSYDASPGGVLEDHIAIVNFAAHAQTLNVYTVDAVTGASGDFVYGARSSIPKQVGAWLSVGTTAKRAGQVTIGPHKTMILPVFLHVPVKASPGDHAGAVIVSLTGLVKGKKGQLVKFEQRIATRVIIRVSGPLHPRLSIEDLHAQYLGHLNPFSDGTVKITYTVRNTGNVLLGASQGVTVHGLFGSTVHAKSVPGVPLLLPGGAYRVSAQVPGVVPEISVTATVRLEPVGLRGDVNPVLRVVTANAHLWAAPWLLVIVVIVLALVITGLIWRRRRRSKAPAPASVGQTPQGVKP
jgi:hypothetical protein